VRFNGDGGSLTRLFVDDLDSAGSNVAGVLATWDDSTSTVKGFLKVYARDTPTTWYEYALSVVSPAAGYTKLQITGTPVTSTAGCPGLCPSPPFAAATAIRLCFRPNGDAGSTGGTGGTGATGPTGPGMGGFTGRCATLGANNTTGYCAPAGMSTKDTTEANVQGLSTANACTAQALSVKVSAAPTGATKTRTFCVMDDGAATAVCCTITNAETTCNSGVSTASIAAGSTWSLRSTAANTPNAADAYFGWECRP
jgi:hypothetical protein